MLLATVKFFPVERLPLSIYSVLIRRKGGSGIYITVISVRQLPESSFAGFTAVGSALSGVNARLRPLETAFGRSSYMSHFDRRSVTIGYYSFQLR